jgi:hypothetical protein
MNCEYNTRAAARYPAAQRDSGGVFAGLFCGLPQTNRYSMKFIRVAFGAARGPAGDGTGVETSHRPPDSTTAVPTDGRYGNEINFTDITNKKKKDE